MKLLIQIEAATELLCHEALSMAFALAAFEHEIQLQLGSPLLEWLMAHPDGKLGKMLSSLDLYDIPPAWVDNLGATALTDWQKTQPQAYAWQSQIQPMPTTALQAEFDTTFTL